MEDIKEQIDVETECRNLIKSPITDYTEIDDYIYDNIDYRGSELDIDYTINEVLEQNIDELLTNLLFNELTEKEIISIVESAKHIFRRYYSFGSMCLAFESTLENFSDE